MSHYQPSSSGRRAKVPLPGIAKTAFDLRNPIQEQQKLSQRRLTTPSFIGRGTPPRAAPKQSLPVRTSKLTQKHVLLPDEIQTRPLLHEESSRPPTDQEREAELLHHAAEARFKAAERMSKEERENEGYKRLTAYAVGERYKMKTLAAFCKREHGAWARQYDEAIYAVYHLPLLPGYSANTTIRSSAPVTSPGGGSIIDQYEEADNLPISAEVEHNRNENDNVDSHSLSHSVSPPRIDNQGFLSNEAEHNYPLEDGKNEPTTVSTTADDAAIDLSQTYSQKSSTNTSSSKKRKWRRHAELSMNEMVAEAVHFDYGVSVFYNMTESQENDILDDIVKAGVVVRPLSIDNREIEQCHYGQDSSISSSRIFNDFFTFKTSSHFLKLSLAHALAQSTKLSAFEETTLHVLESASTIPKELAVTGTLALDRRQALKLTGKLFKLRVDVNLVSNVLDVPELFWSETGLKALYDAGREYFEIGARVQVLNERLAVAGDLLDIIHEHVNEQGMSRITIIIIWLIVIACLVAVGEVGARLMLHALRPQSKTILERLMGTII